MLIYAETCPAAGPAANRLATLAESSKAILDIETRSASDLKAVGTYVYAAHPTTSITHFGFKLDDGPTVVWRPNKEPIPADLLAALADPAVTLVAHNSGFERTLLTGPPGHAIGVPVKPLQDMNRWSCTAARAARIGLPRELSRLCIALKLPVKKDAEGHRLMLQVCKPKRDGSWWDDEQRMERISRYCAQDVEAEYLLDGKLPDLTSTERQLWAATERANDRGVGADVALLRQLGALAEVAIDEINARISELTNGEVPKVSNHQALTKWLNSRGVETGSCDKFAVQDLLDREDLDDTVGEVLELRQEGGGSSIAKIPSILRRLSADKRLRGALVYGGAPSTVRWSSHGAQLQNLPRHNKAFDIEAILSDLQHEPDISELEYLHGPPTKICAELIRPAFVAAPGHVLVRGDFSQIEARVLAWFADEGHRLRAFREGRDLYKVAASAFYHVPESNVDEDQRFLGKVAELACGYQGGVRALQKMARNFNRKLSKGEAEQLRDGWRAANPRIVSFWRAIEDAAFQCVATKRDQRLGKLTFSLRGNALTMQLPSGRCVVYWQPSIKQGETPWGELRHQVHCYSEDNVTHKWTEFKLYGGHLAENCCQSTARDIMAEAWLRLLNADFEIVLSVHDELVVETDREDAVAAVKALMEQPPAWASGLPIATDVKAGERYEMIAPSVETSTEEG